jgi:hypothetical protein
MLAGCFESVTRSGILKWSGTAGTDHKEVANELLSADPLRMIYLLPVCLAQGVLRLAFIWQSLNSVLLGTAKVLVHSYAQW